MIEKYINDFMAESNSIEGIHATKDSEIVATIKFVQLKQIELSDLIQLLRAYQPDAILRNKSHLNVRVGNHIPPRGGKDVEARLVELLQDMSNLSLTPYEAHHRYEKLHPFTDGNGRTGRALWLWMMDKITGVPRYQFLHYWYYQSLTEYRSE